jgi:hypothetical protein
MAPHHYSYDLPQGQEEGPIFTRAQIIGFVILTALVAILFWGFSHFSLQGAVEQMWWDLSDALFGEPHLRGRED